MQRSFDELGTPLSDVTFCVLDLETTGGNRNDDMITEVGVVKVRGGECLGTFQTLVNPGKAIPPQITVLTGLTDALVAPAPRIEAVLPSLLSFLGDSVLVAHNASFDIGFIRAALARADRPSWNGTIVDTVHLARRLVRDEVPNCKLSTLAVTAPPRPPAEPPRARRCAGHHRPAAPPDRASVRARRPRTGRPGRRSRRSVGIRWRRSSSSPHRSPAPPASTCSAGHGDSVLYVGKATNLRQRVRSYFGSDDRRKIGPMLRETQAITHVELPDPLTAEVVETRFIGRLLPRYNRRGTRADEVLLRQARHRHTVAPPVDREEPGRSVASTSARCRHERWRTLVVEALQTALPLRRCTQRLGRNYVAPDDAPICSAAQLGVAHCPCSGTADPTDYAASVAVAVRAMGGDPAFVVERLRERMAHARRPTAFRGGGDDP